MNTEIDITGIELHTERMILRPWKLSDLEDFYAYASVDGVGQMAGWQPHQNIEESRHILELFIQGKKTLAIVKDGRCIGSLGIEKYNEDKFPEFASQQARELGFVLAKPYWGQGLMPEAVREVIRWLFQEKHLDLIFCGYFTWNHQSQRVQQKCGFVPYRIIEYTNAAGKIEETQECFLTRENWQKMVG